MFYLRYLCLFAHSVVQHKLCCVFALFVFVLCLVYHILPVCLDCPFLIAHSVFSNVYLNHNTFTLVYIISKSSRKCHITDIIAFMITPLLHIVFQNVYCNYLFFDVPTVYFDVPRHWQFLPQDLRIAGLNFDIFVTDFVRTQLHTDGI